METDYKETINADDSNILTLSPEGAAEMQRLIDNVSAVTSDSHVQPIEDSVQPVDNLFILEPGMAEQMQQLIDNATPIDQSLQSNEEQRGSAEEQEGRVLRSAGKELSWNPEMGNEHCILER